jgi:hypothetical protein
MKDLPKLLTAAWASPYSSDCRLAEVRRRWEVYHRNSHRTTSGHNVDSDDVGRTEYTKSDWRHCINNLVSKDTFELSGELFTHLGCTSLKYPYSIKVPAPLKVPIPMNLPVSHKSIRNPEYTHTHTYIAWKYLYLTRVYPYPWKYPYSWKYVYPIKDPVPLKVPVSHESTRTPESTCFPWKYPRHAINRIIYQLVYFITDEFKNSNPSLGMWSNSIIHDSNHNTVHGNFHSTVDRPIQRNFQLQAAI